MVHTSNAHTCAFFMLRQSDIKKVRVKELRRAVQRIYSVSKTHSRCAKQQLAEHLRKAQVARRFSRLCAARIQTRRLANRQFSDEYETVTSTAHNAIVRIQHWWRHIKSFVAINRVDPITMDVFSRRSERENTFYIVLENRQVYRYAADCLFYFLHSRFGVEEPICRRVLNIAELRRLDKQVSPSLFNLYGSSTNILSADMKALGLKHTAHVGTTSYIEDTLNTIIADIANAFNLSNVQLNNYISETLNNSDSITNEVTTECEPVSMVRILTIPVELCHEFMNVGIQLNQHDHMALQTYLTLKLKELDTGNLNTHTTHDPEWDNLVTTLIRVSIEQLQRISNI